MATIEIYIKNFVQGGNVNTTTTLFQTVPINTEFSIIDPKVKAEMGKAPTFEFAMDPEHPFYYSVMQMQTLFRIDYVGHTIFRGRALTIDVDMMGRKSIHCEGDFAFLMDTPQPGTKEETRPVISVSNYLQQVINQHNSLCGDQAHRFILGEYPDHYTNQTLTEQRIVPAAEQNNQKFGNSSWNTTMDRFEDLLNSFGGYWRTRYVDEQHVYLDWLDQYFRPMNDTRQPIMVASNLLEFNGTNAVDNIFTAVIPIGKRDSKDLYITEYWPSISPGHPKVNFITVPEIVSLGIFSDEELSRGQHTKEDYQNATNHYGIIFKIVSFENADSEDKLFSYVTDWIKNNYLGSITSYDITALDIASYDPTKDPILCGDEVQIGHPSVGIRNLTVISVDYDLYNPWKSKYKIGSPNNLLNAAYGVANKKKNGKSSGGGISGGPKDGNNGDTPSEAEQDKMYLETQYSIKTDQGVDIELDNNLAFLVHDGHGNKIVGSTTEERQQLLEKMRPVVGEIRKLVSIPNWSENAEDLIEIGDFPKIKAARDAWRQEVQQYAMSIGISQDKAEILTNTREGTTWLANIIDDNGNLKPPWNLHPNAVQLKQMASNVRQALRGNIVSIAEIAAKENSAMQIAGDILGENIIGGEGFSYVDSAKQLLLNGGEGGGNFSIDLTGKTVEFDELEVVRKVVDEHGETRSFGFYDEGNLDAGVLVEKLSDGVTTTKISSNYIDLTGDQITLTTGSATTITDSLTAITGSAFWQNRNNISAIVGEFEYSGTGTNRHLVIKNGGGFRVKRNNTEFGLYDEGNLDAGVIVGKLSDGVTTTKIQSTYITLDGQAVADSLETQTVDVQELHAAQALSIERANGFTYNTVTVNWKSLYVDNVFKCEFLGNKEDPDTVNISIVDTETYRTGVSTAGALTASWSGADVDHQYNDTYTVRSGTNESRSVTVSMRSGGWTGISSGHAGTCTLYATAGGADRAQYLITGNAPYQQGLTDGAAQAATFEDPTYSGNTYDVSTRNLVEHLSNGATQTIPMRITRSAEWAGLDTNAPFTSAWLDTQDPGGSGWAARMRLVIYADEPYAEGYAKGLSEGYSSADDIRTEVPQVYYHQTQPSGYTAMFTSRKITTNKRWYAFKTYINGHSDDTKGYCFYVDV